MLTAQATDLLAAQLFTQYRERNEWRDSDKPLVLDMFRKLQQAIDTRDYGELLYKLHTGNKSLRTYFATVTGVRLPSTERATVEALAHFVGPEQVRAYAAAQAAERKERHAEQQQRAREQLYHGLQAERIRYQGTVMGMADFIARLIAEGYTTLEEEKRGAVKTWSLCRSFGDSYREWYPLKKKAYAVYAQSLLAAHAAPAAEG